jgi:hypothetical protein
MSSLVQTIDETLGAIGREPRDMLMETLGAFDLLRLPDEARVSAIATALTTTASTHHAGHIEKFLDAVQIWALEAVSHENPSLPKVGPDASPRLVLKAAATLTAGLDNLLDALNRAAVSLQDRVVAELTLFTRLLAAHDVRTILLTVGSASCALGSKSVAGKPVMISLRESSPANNFVDLALIPAQGQA